MPTSKTSQFILDIIMPRPKMSDPSMPSDAEAGALYSLWKSSPPGTNTFSVPIEHRSMISAWKVKGLVDGMAEQLCLTDKGKKLIVEMVTNEPNAFSKKSASLSYNEIRSKKKQDNERRMSKKAFNIRRQLSDSNNQ